VHDFVLRKRTEAALVWLDFSSHSETEILLHAGQTRQAREAVQRRGERLGSNRRFHIPLTYVRPLDLCMPGLLLMGTNQDIQRCQYEEIQQECAQSQQLLCVE
jgi:hypothetical protein